MALEKTIIFVGKLLQIFVSCTIYYKIFNNQPILEFKVSKLPNYQMLFKVMPHVKMVDHVISTEAAITVHVLLDFQALIVKLPHVLLPHV